MYISVFVLSPLRYYNYRSVYNTFINLWTKFSFMTNPPQPFLARRPRDNGTSSTDSTFRRITLVKYTKTFLFNPLHVYFI